MLKEFKDFAMRGNVVDMEGAAAINYGIFIDNVINFLIVAIAVFMLIKAINSLKKKEEEKPAEPPKPSNEEVLLAEIRDLLANR